MSEGLVADEVKIVAPGGGGLPLGLFWIGRNRLPNEQESAQNEVIPGILGMMSVENSSSRRLLG